MVLFIKNSVRQFNLAINLIEYNLTVPTFFLFPHNEIIIHYHCHPTKILYHPTKILYHLTKMLYYPTKILYHPTKILYHLIKSFVIPQIFFTMSQKSFTILQKSFSIPQECSKRSSEMGISLICT